ncbi:MAG: cysteine desulfurase family protein [Caldicoprobacterales bacterium]|jgi:cysteine desulfurase|nr:cysteine desulfurase [Clostridiales bacterium]
MTEIYLDYAATTPVIPQVIEAVTDCLKNDYGNPSSMHRLGIQAEKRIKDAKNQVSHLLNAAPDEIVFTSGGTESNNMAILGAAYDKKRRGMHCITTVIEHPSVLQAFAHLEEQGYEVTYLSVDRNGIISLDELKKSIRDDTILVSIMHINNETGSVQPIRQIGAVLNGCSRKPVFHVDAIQSFGKLPVYPEQMGIDLLSVSGHKIHAPKGVGALYIRKGVRIKPILFGGNQQGGIRSGTENIPGIVGLGTGAGWIAKQQNERGSYLSELKNRLVKGISQAVPTAVINGSRDTSAPHIINVGFPGLRGEVLLHALEEEGVYVSTGSACSSRNRKQSHVLKAMGLDNQLLEGSIRISTSYLTTLEEIEAFLPVLTRAVARIERYTRR